MIPAPSRSLEQIDADRERLRAAPRRAVVTGPPPEALVQGIAAFLRWVAEDPEDRDICSIRLYPDGSGCVYGEHDAETIGWSDLEEAARELRQLDPVALRRESADPSALAALVRREFAIKADIKAARSRRRLCEVDREAPCYETDREPCPACLAGRAETATIRSLAGKLTSIEREKRKAVGIT